MRTRRNKFGLGRFVVEDQVLAQNFILFGYVIYWSTGKLIGDKGTAAICAMLIGNRTLNSLCLASM